MNFLPIKAVWWEHCQHCWFWLPTNLRTKLPAKVVKTSYFHWWMEFWLLLISETCSCLEIGPPSLRRFPSAFGRLWSFFQGQEVVSRGFGSRCMSLFHFLSICGIHSLLGWCRGSGVDCYVGSVRKTPIVLIPLLLVEEKRIQTDRVYNLRYKILRKIKEWIYKITTLGEFEVLLRKFKLSKFWQVYVNLALIIWQESVVQSILSCHSFFFTAHFDECFDRHIFFENENLKEKVKIKKNKRV